MDSRYRGGETNPKAYPTTSADVILPGDMLYWDATAKTARPAAGFTWTTDLPTTQTAFRLVFLGVSGSQKLAGSTKSVVVLRAGNFDFDCASFTGDPGSLMGPAKQSGNALENQKVASVATNLLAIGRTERINTAVTKVRVEVMGAFTTDGGVKAIP